MISKFKNIPHHLVVHCISLLLLLSFSIIVFTIPAQSERRQHIIVKAQSNEERLLVSVQDHIGKARIPEVIGESIPNPNSIYSLQALILLVPNILSMAGYACGIVLIGPAIFFPVPNFNIPFLNLRASIARRFLMGSALILLAFFISLVPNFIFAIIDAGRFE